MRFHASIRALGLAACMAAGSALAISALASLKSEWDTYNYARTAEEAAEVLAGVSNAVIPLSLERSVTQVGLSLETPVPSEFLSLVAEQRAKAGKALVALEKALDHAAHLPRAAQLAHDVRTLNQRFATIRAAADAALARPRSERPATAAAIPAEIMAAIEQFQMASNIVRDRKMLDAVGVALLDQVNVRAWVVREYGGRERTQMAIAALNKAAVAAETIGLMRENHGRAVQAWQDVLRVRGSMTPAATEAIDAVRRDYFDTYATLRGQMYAASGGGAYPVDFQTFFSRSTAALATAEQLVETTGREIIATAKRVQAQSFQKLLMQIAMAFGLVLLIVAQVWIVVFRIVRRIDGLNDAMARLAVGDLSIDTRRFASRDEIGAMAASVETFRENAVRIAALKEEEAAREARARMEKQQIMNDVAEQFERSIGGIVSTVSSAATELEASARMLTSSAAETTTQSARVSEAAGEASSNVQSVTAASEELAQSIREIGQQVEQSSTIASRAVHEAAATGEQMKALAAAADKIGSIVSMITDIAARTNLLALNATIEAARAGDAGRGFAIVAQEVKGLADQTAKATADIEAQIQAIQTTTRAADGAMTVIGSTISEINTVATRIAAAVEEQGAATKEISRSVANAHAGTASVTATIAEVHSTASASSSAATEVLSAANELSHQSELLRGEVSHFLSAIRAA